MVGKSSREPSPGVPKPNDGEGMLYLDEFSMKLKHSQNEVEIIQLTDLSDWVVQLTRN